MEIFWLRHAETQVAAAVYSIPKIGKLAPGVVAQFWLKVEDLLNPSMEMSWIYI